MAGAKFNLLNPAYWEALVDVVDLLESQEIPYAVVGGAAAQIWICSLLSGNGLSSIDGSADIPLRLRTTRDVDLSTRAEAAHVLEALNRLAATARPPITVLSPRAARVRQVLVNLTLEPMDVSGFSMHYDAFLERAQRITLRRGAEHLTARVISLPDLLATKLSRRGNQAKDLLDVDALCLSLLEARQTVPARNVRAILETATDEALMDDYMSRYPKAFE